MKKSISLITASIIIVSLAGCGSVSTPIKSNSQQTNTPGENQTTSVNATQSQTTSSTANSTIPDTQAGTPNVKGGIPTPRGVVWTPSPSMNNNGNGIPTLLSPYSLYLSPNNTNQLQTSSAEKILTLPLTENTPTGQFYVYLNDYFYSDNWIVYSIYLMKPGMAQAYSHQLRAVNLDTKKDILITDFHNAGGYSFAVASDNNMILFSQKSPGPGVTYLKQINMFNLDNGQKESVDPKNLEVIPEKNTVEYSKDGQTLTFQLQLKDSVGFAFE